MPEEYMTPSQRAAKRARASATEQEKVIERHRHLVGAVLQGLQRRQHRSEGEGMVHVEVLKPANAWDRLLRGSDIVTLPNVHKGPDFKVGRKLEALLVDDLVRQKIDKPEYGDGISWSSGVVTLEGEVWGVGDPVEGASNIYQVLDRNKRRLRDLRSDELEVLRRHLPVF